MCKKKIVENIVIEERDSDKWNLLWDYYANGTLAEEVEILCDYYSGINGEGHNCYFDNCSSRLEKIIFSLKSLLPEDYYGILYKAYKAYCRNVFVTRYCDKADKCFYQNEQIFVDLLLRYARELTEIIE